MRKSAPNEAKEAIELARTMAYTPGSFGRFGNAEQILPRLSANSHYIEGTVAGTGQYRVVCEVDEANKVRRKYWCPSHYSTGADADRKPGFIELQ